MPIVGPTGGAQAGFGSGGSFTGAAEALEYVGQHAYAYSGAVAVANSEVTLINFEIGNSLFVGTWSGYFNQASNAAIELDDYRFVLYLNGVQIMAIETSDSASQNRNINRDLIIPPFTTVLITCQNYSGTSSNNLAACMTGEIFK